MKYKKHIIFLGYPAISKTLCKRESFNDGIYVWKLHNNLKDANDRYDEYILKHNICKNCFKNYLKNISREIKQY